MRYDMAIVEVVGITKTYLAGDQTIRAVDDVSLSVREGDFLSVVGHSGSGKTTLLSLIGGIIRPSSGRMLYKGEDICALDDDRLSEYRNEKIGFMFQFSSLLPILTAKENVLLPRLFAGNGGAVSDRKAKELLEVVGLQDKADSYPAQLSGGQQRRVAIARALMNDPEVILADEPTGDLDEETEGEIMELFQGLNSVQKVTFILITHNLDLAGKASRQIRMKHGRIETG
jgi:ABC-type lipoprotein export system ATPase subunit